MKAAEVHAQVRSRLLIRRNLFRCLRFDESLVYIDLVSRSIHTRCKPSAGTECRRIASLHIASHRITSSPKPGHGTIKLLEWPLCRSPASSVAL